MPNVRQLWTLLLLLCPFWLLSQKGQIDSLIDVAWDMRLSEADNAIRISESILQLALDQGNEQAAGTINNILGISHRYKGQYGLSENFFEEALRIRNRLADSAGVASVYNNLSFLMVERGEFLQAVQYGLKAIRFWERSGERHQLYAPYLNIASAYTENRDYEKAIAFNRKALEIARAYDDPGSVLQAGSGLATTLYENKQYDSAYHYYNQALHYSQVLQDSIAMASTYQALGDILRIKKQTDASMDMVDQSIAIYQSMLDSMGLFYSYLSKSRLFEMKADYQQGLLFCQMAEDVISGKGGLNEYKNLNDQYTDLYKAKGNFAKALEYNERSYELDNQIFSEEKSRQIAEVETKYETEKLKRENAESAVENQRKTTQRNTLLIVCSLLLLTLFGSIYYYQYRQKINALLQRQNEQIHQQQITELLKVQELEFISARLEGQELERERISKELHDNLGSMMVSAKWQFGNLLEKLDAGGYSKDSLHKANELLEKTYQELRRIAFDISTGNVRRIGIEPALKDLCQSISAGGKLKAIVTTHALSGKLDDKLEITIYRIIQELVSNVLKHAQASKIDIQLNQLDQELNIMVEDNGKGFKPEKITSDGMGLKNIENRVLKLNGTFSIDSGKGAGTTVLINVPLASRSDLFDQQINPNEAVH
ncbi:MAG: sensor histidine kinase [Bacteroidota bacterium]